MKNQIVAIPDWNVVPDRLTPAQITAVYILFGLVLLYFSDVLLPALIADPSLLKRVQAVKGGVEILITGGLIYVLVDQMERQLQQSEQRYENLIRNSPVPINLFDADGVIKWGNDAVLDLLGLDDRDELVGRSIFEFIHEDDRDVGQAELDAVIEEGASIGPTYMRVRRVDDEIRDVRVSTAPGRYDGQRIGQAVVTDVTELRKIEDELRRERDFIKNATDELRDIFYVIDEDGNLERWNSQLAVATGYDDDSLASMTAFDFVPPADEQRVREAIALAKREGTSFVEVELIMADGDRRNYELKGALLDRADQRARLVGIGRDITDRKEMEEQLRDNERRYRTLVEMSPNPILVHRDGQIVYANGAIVDLLDAEWRGDLVGRDFTQFLAESERSEAAELATKTQHGEASPTRMEWTVTTVSGETRYAESISRPIAYERDPAVLTILNDVTHRHHYEEMLRTLHDRTREMTRAVESDAIADIVVETVDQLLDVDATVVCEYDGSGRLHPLSWSSTIEDHMTDTPSVGAEGGILWEAFVEGEEREFDETTDDVLVRDLPLRDGLVLPIENHGVLVAGYRETGSLSSTGREILHLIGETLAAAFDRALREGDLRERDRQLQRQNEALAQLNRLNEIIREINQALIRSSTAVQIREEVCEHIASAPQYSMAWIGTLDPVDEQIKPQHWSGMDAEFIDQLAADGQGTRLLDLVETARLEDTIEVVDNLLEDPAWADSRRMALANGYQSVAAVPVHRGDQVDSVLVIHAKNPGIFDEREQAVLEELGETIGYALHNVARAETIQADTRTEIELEINDDRLFPNQLSHRLDTDVELAGSVEVDSDTLQAFLRITDVEPKVALDALQEFEAVGEARSLAEADNVGIYQVTMAIPPLIRVLRARDVRIRSFIASRGSSTLILGLPGASNVRSVVEEISGLYANTELLARREETDPVDTRETFRKNVLDKLTEKQLNALKTAQYGGYFEWPRDSSSEELAEARGIAASTFQYHLRAAERKVVDAILS